MKINHKKSKTIISVLATLGLSFTAITSVSAWGPERATFTMENPATYPTFNSITNNPTIGDERDFVRVGEIDAKVTDLKNEVEVVPGRQYLVYVYFHNNASSTFNDSAHNNSGVALRTRMATSFSTVLTPAEKGTITATITADNSNPLSVWDEAYMTTKTEKILMHYVPGSAKIYNDWKANGSVMPSSLFTSEGTLVGLNALNGVIPGCEEYHGVVSYVLQAEELGGSIDKAVSKDGIKFRESAILQPGEEATYQLTIVNTGDVALTNATVKDVLPEGLTLVPGSVTLRANDSTTEDPLSDNIFGAGYNLGTIGTGNTVYITYKVKAGDNFDCNGQELKNDATLTYDSNLESGEIKEDSTTITVRKEDGCEEPEPPLDNCETNPSLPECQEKNCKTNPEMEGCQELPNTGPLEIVMAIIVILGIGGGGYYLYRTRKTLNKVEKTAKGEKPAEKAEDKPEVKESEQITKDSSQKPDNMVK
ncbi:DUF11 domain-containing protein [Candidatus Saccharibacteria bacterium]|nr:DUF11 domain-containing protein [Candidatus Saccharibacteria bacterium]